MRILPWRRNVVSKPNDWTKEAGGARRRFGSGFSETKQLQLEYWVAFREALEERGGLVKPTKPPPQHWQSFTIGRSYFHVNTLVNTREKSIGVQLVVHGEDGKAHFHLLRRMQQEIESAVSESLEWRENPEKKDSHGMLRRPDSDPSDRSTWPEQHDWLYEKLQLFHKAFSGRVKNLNAADWMPEESGA